MNSTEPSSLATSMLHETENGASATQSPAHHRAQFVLNRLLSYAGVVCPGLTAIGLIPIMVHGLGFQSYGLWIIAGRIAAILGNLDLGLGTAVSREAGVARSAGVTASTQQFIRSAGNTLILLAATSTIIMTMAAVPLNGSFHLAPSLRNCITPVFFLAGVALLGEWLIDYARSILVGLGRFGTIAWLNVGGAFLRAAGVVVAIWLWESLIAVATWWAACQLVLAFVSLVVVGRIEPRYSFRPYWPNWRALVPHLSFSVTSLIGRALYQFFWQAPALAVPLLRGSAALVPFEIGQKFPMATLGFTHSGGDVLFAESSVASTSEDRRANGDLLRATVRWNFMFVFPILIGFAAFTPALLHVWLGVVPAGSVGVARIVTVAALLDCVSAPILYFLWGHGLAKTVLPAVAVGAAVATLASLLLVPTYGVGGTAAGLLLGALMMVLLLIRAASTFSGLGLTELARTLRGFAIPGVLCAGASLLALHYAAPRNWFSLLTSACPAGMVFAAAFYCFGATEGERHQVRRLLRPFLGRPTHLSSAAYEPTDVLQR